MSLSEKETLLIQKYLDRELSAEEMLEVGVLKSQSEEFKRELIEQKAFVSSLKAHRKKEKIAALRQVVKEQEIDLDAYQPPEEEPEEETKTIPLNSSQEDEKTGSPIYFKIAAALLVLIVASVLIYNQYRGIDSDALYLSYYEPLEASIVTRSYTVDAAENPLDLYEKGEYEKAIKGLKEVLTEPGASVSLNIYLGISLMETGKDEEAKAIFTEVYKKYPNDFTGQHAEWYLALMQLKKKPKASKALFQTIVNQGGVYERPAKEILEKL